MSVTHSELTDVAGLDWDVIVIGTGMGGAAAGWRLSQAGQRVLFVEAGGMAEMPPEEKAEGHSEDPEERLAKGRWPTPLRVTVDGSDREVYMPLGSGAGGSTLLYGAALERLDRRDFAPGAHVADKGQSDLPHTWPVSYDSLLPYYEEVERLFMVTGKPDPLDPDDTSQLLEPPALGARDAHFQDSFSKLGLHPYRQHVAMKYIQGCMQCMGRVCTKDCKLTARNVFLEPALASGARLLLNASAEKIVATRDRVTGVVVSQNGQTAEISATLVILAAGAFFSPALLLRSANENWPAGVGNANGLVGRYLMFHGDNRIAVWPLGGEKGEGPKKSICFKDFYALDGRKFGTVQAMGVEAGRAQIYEFLEATRQEWGIPKLPLMKIAFKVMALIAAKIFGPAKVFTGIMEDLPYQENRVTLDASAPSGIRLHYTIHDELRARTELFRKMIRERLKPHRTILVDRGVRLNYGHPAGTCRFGHDPQTSVLDPSNKVHGLENLFVVDASFFPTSGGINPSLTIAANSLRVVDEMFGRQKANDARAEPAQSPVSSPAE